MDSSRPRRLHSIRFLRAKAEPRLSADYGATCSSRKLDTASRFAPAEPAPSSTLMTKGDDEVDGNDNADHEDEAAADLE